MISWKTVKLFELMPQADCYIALKEAVESDAVRSMTVCVDLFKPKVPRASCTILFVKRSMALSTIEIA